MLMQTLSVVFLQETQPKIPPNQHRALEEIHDLYDASLFRAVFLNTYKSGKVIDYAVLSKHCSGCKKWEVYYRIYHNRQRNIILQSDLLCGQTGNHTYHGNSHPIPNITDYHHFHFDGKSPAVVLVGVLANDEEKDIRILPTATSFNCLPSEIVPKAIEII